MVQGNALKRNHQIWLRATLWATQNNIPSVVHGSRTQKKYVRSGIRTHAHRSGLRPERSALDRSAILTA